MKGFKMFSRKKRPYGKGILTGLAIGVLSLFLMAQSGPLLRMPEGTTSVPGLSFYLNNNVGLYDAGNDTLGVSGSGIVFTNDTDTYNVVGVADGDETQSYFINPLMPLLTQTSILADATATDSEMIVQTFYLPFPMTVGAIRGIAEEGADKANDTGYLGAAIYNNADDGTKLFTCSVADLDATAVVDCDGTDVDLPAGFYRIGFCSENVSDMMWGGALPTELDMGVLLATVPILSNPISEGANDCTGSSAEVPASTTGALTDNVTEVPFWVLSQD